ncbi:MAG: hypothetical protein ACOYL6_08555 [Bacteriovoracaceae bacterium]
MKHLILAISLFSSLSSFAQEFGAPGLCAVAYNKADPMLTRSLTFANGNSVTNLNAIPLSPELGSWDNKVTKVDVARGCTFIGYQYQNFGIDYNTGKIIGFVSTLENNTTAPIRSFFLTNTAYDNKFSSAKCFCL